MNSGGNRSGRVDRICPSLQKVGPSSSSASRIRLACRRRPSVPSSSGRPNSSFSPCLAKTAAIFEPRAARWGWVSVSTWEERTTVRVRGVPDLGAVATWPFVVLTMITVQRALWLIRLGTLPSRNSLRPAIPALPTTRTSIPCSSVACTIAIAGSSSITTCALPLSPATSAA